MHVVLYTEPSSVPIQCGASAAPPHDAASGQIPRKTYGGSQPVVSRYDRIATIVGIRRAYVEP